MMRRLLHTIATLTLLLVPMAAATAAAQTPATPSAARAAVLVVPFTVQASPSASGLAGAPYWLGEAAAIAVSDQLAAQGVTVVHRSDRVNAFELLQLPMSGSLSRATIIRAGEMMGAAAVVVGDLQLNERMTMRARVIDLRSAQQFADARADGAGDAFFDMTKTLASGLVVDLPRTGVSGPVHVHPPLAAFEDFVKGLVATSPDLQAKFLESAHERAPSDARTLVALWQVRTAQGDYAKALADAQQVPASAPESRTARFLAAQSLIALKRNDDAFAALDALYKESANAAVSNALGIVQLRRGGTPQTGTPVFYLNRAADESGNDSQIAFNLGYAYALAGDATSAIYWLREVVRGDAGDGQAHRLLGAMLAVQGKTVEAQREFDLARLLGAMDGVAAEKSDRLDKLDKTVPKGLERVITDLTPPIEERVPSLAAQVQAQAGTAPKDPPQAAVYYVERGRRMMGENRDREAIDEFRRALYVSPYFDQPHLELGRIYMRTGRVQDAIEEFTLALWCDETAPAHAALATAELAAGKKDLAKTSAQRALALDPSNTEARDVLRQVGGMLESA